VTNPIYLEKKVEVRGFCMMTDFFCNQRAGGSNPSTDFPQITPQTLSWEETPRMPRWSMGGFPNME